MAVAWAEFLAVAGVVKQLYATISLFKERGKKNFEVLAAAEEYRQYFRMLRQNYDLAELMQYIRTRLEFYKLFRQDFNFKINSSTSSVAFGPLPDDP